MKTGQLKAHLYNIILIRMSKYIKDLFFLHKNTYFKPIKWKYEILLLDTLKCSVDCMLVCLDEPVKGAGETFEWNWKELILLQQQHLKQQLEVVKESITKTSFGFWKTVLSTYVEILYIELN